jgi:hypothetical protein
MRGWIKRELSAYVNNDGEARVRETKCHFESRVLI